MNQQENGEQIVLNQVLNQDFSFQFYVTYCIKLNNFMTLGTWS